jgi:hypothetical protein
LFPSAAKMREREKSYATTASAMKEDKGKKQHKTICLHKRAKKKKKKKEFHKKSYRDKKKT